MRSSLPIVVDTAGTFSTPVDPKLILEALPNGVLLVGSDQSVVPVNSVARQLLPNVTGQACRCFRLFRCRGPDRPCEHGCLALRAGESGELLPEVRLDVRSGSDPKAVWVQFVAAGELRGTLAQVRPAHQKDRRRRSEPFPVAEHELRIYTLGRMNVDFGYGTAGEMWLDERPGKVLKYLICHRDTTVRTDAIADALWPSAGSAALTSARHAMHRLRSKLEPHRSTYGKSSFIVSVPGGYALDRRNIWIDVVRFEELVCDGLASLRELELTAATTQLEQAVALYRGPFLGDDLYTEWAFEERNRLQGLAEKALRALAVLARERDDPTAAIGFLDRLCALEPYDDSAHRELISELYSAGRLRDAKTRYTAYRHRMQRDFGVAPRFDLKSLGPRPGAG